MAKRRGIDQGGVSGRREVAEDDLNLRVKADGCVGRRQGCLASGRKVQDRRFLPALQRPAEPVLTPAIEAPGKQ
jgi:hypothetical protein